MAEYSRTSAHRPNGLCSRTNSPNTEEEAIVTICYQPEYQSLPPSWVVRRLADQGRLLPTFGCRVSNRAEADI